MRISGRAPHATRADAARRRASRRATASGNAGWGKEQRSESADERVREVVGLRVGVRGEIELELCGEDGCEGGGGLGGAGEGDGLEGGLGVDVYVTRVDGPARAERRAHAAGVVAVVVLVGGDVGGGAGEGEEGVVVREEVGFGDAELEVEDVGELTLDAADVTHAEDPRAQRPVNVLKRGIVQVLEERMCEARHDVERETYLVSEDECAEEDALVGPLLERNLNVWLGPLDVDEGHEEGQDLDLRLGDDVRD